MTEARHKESIEVAVDQLIYKHQSEWSRPFSHNKLVLRNLIVETVRPYIIELEAQRDVAQEYIVDLKQCVEHAESLRTETLEAFGRTNTEIENTRAKRDAALDVCQTFMAAFDLYSGECEVYRKQTPEDWGKDDDTGDQFLKSLDSLGNFFNSLRKLRGQAKALLAAREEKA